MRKAILFSVLLMIGMATTAFGEAYQNAVMALSPSHYWQLNETEEGMVMDSVGGLHGTHAGFLGPGFAEPGVPGPGRDEDGFGDDLPGLGEGNLAFGAYDWGSIDLGPGAALADSTMTISAWFATAGSQGGDRLFTNNQSDGNVSFQIAFGGGFNDTAASLVVGLNPSVNGFPFSGLPSGSGVGNFHLPDSTVPTKDNVWHHIVASRNGSNIEDVIIVIDGVNYDITTWADSTDTWGTTGTNAHIATRTPGDGGGAMQVLNGRVDEMAVWLGRQLTVEEAIGLYEAAINEPGTGPTIDFNGDMNIDCADVDALVNAIVNGGDVGVYDLDGSGSIDSTDLTQWLADAATANGLGSPYKGGDANLDGVVDVSDFNEWNANKFTSNAAWCSGDFNADGVVDVGDFNEWNSNKFTSSDAAAVPEPAGSWMVLSLLVMLLPVLRSRK
ncbi:MAG: LamG-like jellyroll fold domain-containing protein [Planctomycetota bacterium]